MAQLASWLKVFLFAGRPVIDKTGLNGAYDFTVHWTPESQPSPGVGSDPLPAAPNANGLALMAALRSQLGLRLIPQKAPVKILVIEHAEYPDAN